MKDIIDPKKVKRYYELKEQIKELRSEAEKINLEIKYTMSKKNITKITIGHYLLKIKFQNQFKFNNTIVNYLRQQGYEDLIIETYNQDKLKELINIDKLDKQELNKYIIKRPKPALYIDYIEK